ncbi:hypothetical protein GCM10025868_35990 [Angustibacter aerolatus]|uniref:Uncharacterized protein n=1 Tax=Angustibacter aerolatus TaxID=1162965 RepID=A0ABQ6JKD8_9ACTN|nr:hypothetical protein [Angustibacter aerolatus]GMA88349.1 hypothetical protein GCM10025868_35990 [Angustibacter aerolatus]
MYAGDGAAVASTDAAVQATAGLIRTFGGKPVFAEFSSSNGGWTTAGDAPYLVAKADPWDGVTGASVHSLDGAAAGVGDRGALARAGHAAQPAGAHPRRPRRLGRPGRRRAAGRLAADARGERTRRVPRVVVARARHRPALAVVGRARPRRRPQRRRRG